MRNCASDFLECARLMTQLHSKNVRTPSCFPTLSVKLDQLDRCSSYSITWKRISRAFCGLYASKLLPHKQLSLEVVDLFTPMSDELSRFVFLKCERRVSVELLCRKSAKLLLKYCDYWFLQCLLRPSIAADCHQFHPIAPCASTFRLDNS